MTTDTPTPIADLAFTTAEVAMTASHLKWVRNTVVRSLERDLSECRAAFLEIAEYWNGSRNDSAMFDALTHIDVVARAILAKGEGK